MEITLVIISIQLAFLTYALHHCTDRIVNAIESIKLPTVNKYIYDVGDVQELNETLRRNNEAALSGAGIGHPYSTLTLPI